jgi:hypothetical protein
MSEENFIFHGLSNERGLTKIARTHVKAPLGMSSWKRRNRESKARSGAQHEVERCSYF